MPRTVSGTQERGDRGRERERKGQRQGGREAGRGGGREKEVAPQGEGEVEGEGEKRKWHPTCSLQTGSIRCSRSARAGERQTETRQRQRQRQRGTKGARERERERERKGGRTPCAPGRPARSAAVSVPESPA
eukprot:1528960-Rhodomonas_salina.1